MSRPVTVEDFGEWLLEEQLAYLETELDAGRTAGELWPLCFEAADTGPVVHLVRQVVGRGLPLPGELLLRLRPSTLAAVLGQEGLVGPCGEAWESASLSELVSFCLLDRYLRRHASQLWEGLVARVMEEAEALLDSGAQPPDWLLMRLQGQQQRRLQQRHPQSWSDWTPAWRSAARAAIKALADRPRDVSQANAERLLSQQVYTDPGHFLLELLQNADDAGANYFEVDFAPQALTIRHDGAPFDFRDLVGVLSIGQTTKRSTQIGYFGVGFKSVFEVTDRPRLYSGQFAFEIADISVPRGLVPSEGEQRETILVLPLKSGLKVEPYWRKALDLDPAILLNLPHLRRLSWNGPGATVEVSLEQAGEHSVLRHQDGRSHYLRWMGQYRHQGPRPAGKPGSAAVMVAIPVSERGAVVYSPESLGTSLYSFLPIQEASGLSFLVGSHFDVPVDRERLDPASPWNAGVVGCLPEILCRGLGENPRMAWDMLALLPLPEDALAPLFTELPAQLARTLRELPVLPGGLRASEVRLLAGELSDLFDLSQEPALLCPPDARRRRWLELLGASPYGIEQLLEELRLGRRPGRLADSEVETWGALHRHLIGVSASLGKVPVLLDFEGAPLTPDDAVVLDEAWRECFAQPPRSVHPAMVAAADSATLLARLGVRSFDWTDLVAELRANGFSRLDESAVFQRLLEAPRGVTLACLELPLFPDQHGRRGPLVPNGAAHLGLVAPSPGLPIELLPQARFLVATPAITGLLESLRWPRFDLPLLIEALEWSSLSAAEAERLLHAIESSDQTWSGPALQRLAGLSIFESSNGERLPLSCLWTYEDPELARFLPEKPTLMRASSSERVVDLLGQRHRLSRADLDLLLAALPGSRTEAALAFLASRADRMSQAQLQRLFALPLFQGQALVWPERGGVGPRAARPEYIEVLAALGQPVLDRASTETVLPLLVAAGYPLLGLTQLVETLQAVPPPASLLPRLHERFRADSASLHLAFSKELRQDLPVWLARNGRVLAAVDIPPSDRLADLLGRQDWRRSETPDPDCAELFPLLEPEDYLHRVLLREARPGQPLRAQPAWCDSVEKVDRVAEHLPLSYFMVDARGALRDTVLHHASPLSYPWLLRSPLASELIHPDSTPEQKRDCTPLEAALILETYHPLSQEPAVREAFYNYLQAELGSVAAQPEARAYLLEEPLWRSAGGHWKCLDELILDPDLPDLGADWSPHPEIPASLLSALETVLGVGRPDPLTLLSDHLMPAYLERPAARASILEVMARLARGLETSRLRRALRGPDGHGAFPLPGGGDLREAYHPPEDLPGVPGISVLESPQIPLLRRLGLRYLPPVRRLQDLEPSLEDGQALLRLVEWAWQQQPEELDPLWDTLSHKAWVPARDGTVKLARRLFLRSPELEELVGWSPHLFAQRRLPVGLARKLGLKEEGELDAVLVLQHLRQQVDRHERVSGRLYAYLEESLRKGTLSGHYLAEQLKELPWIWVDEGEYRQARHVLSVPSFRYFGPHRGTWEGAHHRFPRLAELFAIPSSVDVPVVLDFLREVHEKQALQPSRRLLRACLTLVGEREGQLPIEWRVLPANRADNDQPLLVSADQSGLVRSNSPTLTGLFASSGRLLVVDPGDSESAPALEKLYQRLGIPRLRDAYTVRPERDGGEVGGELGEAVAAFRALLRALAAVLPRLRAARPEWEEGEWLADTRLRHFMTSGPIRVMRELRLTYELPGVATVAVEAAAAYDPAGAELLTSAAAVTQPAAHAVALAEGLSDLIYQGPGSEGLVDLLNLLLPLGRREAMDAYLDRRHFPRPNACHGANGRAERVGEILDYGLHKLLERRFPEVAGTDWSLWSRNDLALPEQPAAAARHLLSTVGVAEPSGELLEALLGMLTAASLEDVLASLWDMADRPSQEQQPREESLAPTSAAAPTAAAPTAAARPRQALVQGPPANEAREAEASAPAPGVLAGVGQKVLGRLGQWLGVAAAPTVNVLGMRKLIPDVAESYRHPPERHLLVSTKALQGADLYCLAVLGVDFDPRRQMYLPAPVNWNHSFLSSGRTVELSGRPTRAEDPLPKPLYSRLVKPPVVKGSRATLRGPDSMGIHRLSCENPDAEVRYTVELCAAPEMDSGGPLSGELDPRLLKPTAPLSALPPLALEWISWARGSGLPPWQLAQRGRDFVTTHYRYDLDFLASAEMQELANQPLRGDENRVLTLLHAGSEGRYLGRGVCLELAAVLLELLRRARIPAVLASVWMLDMGLIHRPDHAVVLVLMPSSRGPLWVPLEASVDRMIRQGATTMELSRADLLQSAADLVLGPSFAPPGDPVARERAQEEALLSALGSRRRLEVLLECFARSSRYLREVDTELQWLAAKGYLTVDKEELYRVSPRQKDRF